MKPPELPGYEYQGLLGSGGYSDVFLYRQLMPDRQVAIKVLLAEGLSESGRRGFAAEANAMAALSTHPFIVTIFHAEIARSGSPYLVMEYYPRPNLWVRSRSSPLPVAEVLRTGIQVASAMETAHRAGILHRDIKPANILTSEYGRPGLTDFGISSSATQVAEAASGMSIPWSPPEIVVGSAEGDHLADVYSLGATLHTLLSGRSPFEVLGSPNGSLDLIGRIEGMEPPSTGRGDVPGTLERILRQTMAKDAALRPVSAAALAGLLQEVEVELKLAMTQLEVRDESPTDVRVQPEDDDRTNLRGPIVIRPQEPSESRGTTVARSSPDGSTVQRPVARDGIISGLGAVTAGPGAVTAGPGASSSPGPRPDLMVPSGSTVEPMPTTHAHRSNTTDGPAEAPPPAVAAERPRRNPSILIAGVIFLLLAAMVAAKVVVGGSGIDDSATEARDAGPPTTPLLVNVPDRPTGVRVAPVANGSVLVTVDAGASPAEDYRFQSVDGTTTYTPVEAIGSTTVGDGTVMEFRLPASTPLCIGVVAIEGGQESQATPSDGCT